MLTLRPLTGSQSCSTSSGTAQNQPDCRRRFHNPHPARDRKLLAAGPVRGGEQIVLFDTDSALKYTHLEKLPELPVLDPTDGNWFRHLREEQ